MKTKDQEIGRRGSKKKKQERGKKREREKRMEKKYQEKTPLRSKPHMKHREIEQQMCRCL